MIKITIPNVVVSLNKVVAAAKKHYSKYASIKQNIEATVYAKIIEHKIKPVKNYPVNILLVFYLKDRRTDPDNFTSASKKFFLDALKKSNIIIDDSQKYIRSPFIDMWYIDKENPRIEIIIVEPEDDINMEINLLTNSII